MIAGLPAWFLATILGAFVFASGGLLIKLGSARGVSAGNLVLFGLYLAGAICFMGLTLVQGNFRFSPILVLIGAILGFGSVLGNDFWVRAFDVGPTSLTGPLVNTYNALVVLMSVFVFGEQLRWNEVVGIIILLFAVSLISYDPNESLAIKNRSWYGLIALSIFFFFIRTGGLKITEEGGFDNILLLGYGYIVGILFFARRIYRIPRLLQQDFVWYSLSIGFLAGIFSFGGLGLFTFAIANGPASIVAPIFSTNGLWFALMTIVIFRERLSSYQILAMIGLVIGLLLIRI